MGLKKFFCVNHDLSSKNNNQIFIFKSLFLHTVGNKKRKKLKN
jgi:hypothetical protein